MRRHVGIDIPSLEEALSWLTGGESAPSALENVWYSENDVLPAQAGFHKLIMLYDVFLVVSGQTVEQWITEQAALAGFRIVNLQQTTHPDYPGMNAYVGEVATDGFDRSLKDLKLTVEAWGVAVKAQPLDYVNQQLAEAAWATWKAAQQTLPSIPTDIEVQHKLPWGGILATAGIVLVGGLFVWRLSQ